MRPALYPILFGPPTGPQSLLGSDLLAFWDVNRSDLVTRDGSNLVSSWKDIKAGYNAIQATGSAKPVYSATSFGGAPGITFDGTNDCLTAAFQPLPSGGIGSEIWVLVKQDALAADATIRWAFCYGASGSTVQRQLGRNVVAGANRAILGCGDGGSKSVNGSVTVLSDIHVLRAQYGTAVSTLQADGFDEGTLSVVPTTGTSQFAIGSSANNTPSLFWSGQIAAILVTNPLPAARAAMLQTFLINRANNPIIVADGFE